MQFEENFFDLEINTELTFEFMHTSSKDSESAAKTNKKSIDI